MRSPRRLVPAVAAAGLLALATAASSSARTDSGTIHTGVGSEAEAESFPCPGDAAGEAGRTGPVVCLTRQAEAWTLTSDASGECTEGPAGWQGACIRVVEDGDLVRVWGTRGIPPTAFTLTWVDGSETAEGASTRGPSTTAEPEGGADGGTTDGGDDAPVVARQPRPGGSATAATSRSTARHAAMTGGATASETMTGEPGAAPDDATPRLAAPAPSPDPLAGAQDAAGHMPPRAYQPPIGPEPEPFRTGGLAATGLLALAAGGWALRAELRDRAT